MELLLQNYKHPSLKLRKMSGMEAFEARLDYHYRFVYMIVKEDIWFISIGPHDEGLGKK